MSVVQRKTAYPAQVFPWAVVNEVRTSLAAIRFLLSSLHSEPSDQQLSDATRELVRLERLFHEMELCNRQRYTVDLDGGVPHVGHGG